MVNKTKKTDDLRVDKLADVYLFILSKRRQRLAAEKETAPLENFGEDTRRAGAGANDNMRYLKILYTQNK